MIFKKLFLLTTILVKISGVVNRRLPPTHGFIQAPLPEQRLYNRHDIPKSYKYAEPEGYIYSTTSSILRPGPLIPNTYQKIQYAPLNGRIGQKNKNSAAEYTKVPPTLSSASVTYTESIQQANSKNPYRKDHLEPRVPTGQTVSETFKCYSPAQNVDVLSSVSRSPGHNAVYRSFSETVPVEKPKPKYARPYGVYENLEALTTTMVPFEMPEEKMGKPYGITNKHYVVNAKEAEGESKAVGDKTKRQYPPYAKYHRLHLNIARVYSPGQVPVKSPVFADTYSMNLGRLPVHSQAYIPPAYPPLPDHNTVLYPINNSVKKYRFRLP